MWIYSQAHHSQASWFTSHVLLEFWYEKWMLHVLHKFDLVEIYVRCHPTWLENPGTNSSGCFSQPRLMTPEGRCYCAQPL